MNKQEGIREGLKLLLWEITGHYSGGEVDILEYLHSQGVVIKVDKKLPESQHTVKGEHAHGYYEYGQEDMLEAGYVATESIIGD